jgi:hypothetical protein
MARYRCRGAAGCAPAGGFDGDGAGGRGVDGPVITSKSKLDAGIGTSFGLGGRFALAHLSGEKHESRLGGRLRELA